ncbi:dual specificity protein phosphatase family protein [Synechococcus sp. CS-1329]|uniref:protein-tyrosine phosphatase family protein n=1 Tax=Synechococcus sp. CS-1329 TaxID=2847975 RepID=UPI00223B13C4|nr:dual specificity protein phosphatase [Synechococcus sp. CS-1329]MCT0218263.1 dual specificity protein phosphatase family protein [Synechococcus sp. CS-1329]
MRLTWLLLDELAVGTAPSDAHDLDRLEREGVRVMMSLCAAEEAPPPGGMAERFLCARLPLPDHHHLCPPTVQQLVLVLSELSDLRRHGPVYLHCVAGVERSPLVAMAWLIHNHRMSWQGALEYVQETHPGTSPLPEQLAVLKRVPLLTTTAQNHWPEVA